jgi:hypothetical protein
LFNIHGKVLITLLVVLMELKEQETGVLNILEILLLILVLNDTFSRFFMILHVAEQYITYLLSVNFILSFHQLDILSTISIEYFILSFFKCCLSKLPYIPERNHLVVCDILTESLAVLLMPRYTLKLIRAFCPNPRILFSRDNKIILSSSYNEYVVLEG